MIYPSDLIAIAQLKWSQLGSRNITGSKDLVRCYELLKLTSRSFAAVIQQLDTELRDAVAIFYLILRGLDTIEDDTGLDTELKLKTLRTFRDVLKTTDWTFTESSPGEKDAVVLLEFDCILREFHKLKPAYQDVIADITHKMGLGMAEYAAIEGQKNFTGLQTIKDYNVYCHHVAGIVGEGLTRMAVEAGFVTKRIAEDGQLSESMGLFLQKTNIIRDYREDMDEGRSFWPREVWEKYTSELRNFTKPEHREEALHCVSNLVKISLDHVIDCLEYLSNVREPSYFKFTAIPQVMSMATLELVFQNPAIFDRNVKIRRGLAAQLILQSNNISEVCRVFREYVRKIHARNKVEDPNFFEIDLACGRIEQYLNSHDRSCPEYKALHTRPGPYDGDSVTYLLIATAIGCMAFSVAVMLLLAKVAGAKISVSELLAEYKYFISFFFGKNDVPAPIRD